MARNLQNRIEVLEQQIAEIARKKALEDCICGAIVSLGVGLEERFETEMNRICPAHGFRELFILVKERVVPGDFHTRARAIEYPEVNRLLAEYDRRFKASQNRKCRI